MFKNILGLILVLLVSLSGAQAYFSEISLTAKQENTVLGIRLYDIVKFHGNITPSLSTLNKRIISKASSYFGKNTKEIHNLYLNAIPKRSGDIYHLNLGAIVRTKSNDVKVYKLSVRYTVKEIKSPQIHLQEYSLGQANFKIEVSLAERKMIIKSRELDTQMVFPLGVGSFEEGVLNSAGTSILTPRFKTAWLESKRAIYSRKKPRYFAKKPFIRVSTPENLQTGIGFHIQPMPKKNNFIRAFDSHGCIRMQESDLYMLYWMVLKNPTTKTPIVINFRIDDESEHPFPKRNKPFKTVVNIGSKTKKQWKLDKDGLIWVANDWKREAPVGSLVDLDNDHYHNLYNYKTTDFVDAYRKKCRLKSEGFLLDSKNNFVQTKEEALEASSKESSELAKIEAANSKRNYERISSSSSSTWSMKRSAKRALKTASKIADKAEKSYNEAKEQSNLAREDFMERSNKSAKSSYKKCMKRIQTKASKLYKWWVHGL